MRVQTKFKLVLLFTVFYLGIFTVLSLINGDYEFLIYSVVVSFIILFVTKHYHKLHLPLHLLGALSLLGVLHFLGGILRVGESSLYSTYFLWGTMRFDNIIHLLAIFVLTFVAYNLLKPNLGPRMNHSPFFLASILVLVSLGLGAVNEIIEFFVVATGIQAGVGSYVNNALDLVYNAIGAILATIIIVRYHEKAG